MHSEKARDDSERCILVIVIAWRGRKRGGLGVSKFAVRRVTLVAFYIQRDSCRESSHLFSSRSQGYSKFTLLVKHYGQVLNVSRQYKNLG